MILVVSQNLAWQKVCLVPRLVRGEVNRVTSLHAFASGKGPNVIRALAAVDGTGEVLGYAGGETGARLDASLRAEGVPCHCVPIQGETRTCTTLAEPDGSCTEIIEPSPAVTPAEREEMRRVFGARLPAARLLVLSGTAVSGETEDCYRRFVRAAHDRAVPVMLDSSCREARAALTESPEVLKVNARELAEIAESPAGSFPERVGACRELSARYGIRWFIVTRGPEGMEAFCGGTLLHAVPPRVDVVNAIGSGDAAAAGAGWVIHESLGTGSAAEVFSSPSLLGRALLEATAMGTANCLNPVNGKVQRADYVAIRDRIRLRDLSGSARSSPARE